MAEDVRLQYESFPYPSRDPADEAKRLITGSPSHLIEINHYIFRGERDFTHPFRVLFAGGGTGDATIMLAQQLRDAGAHAEIVYLDISDAARAIAEARAKARGLQNIRFVSASITDLATQDLGEFDYIDCCGVLHHLEDPEAALRGLKDSLAPDGGIGLMVYAPLGRTGVYHVQAMLRLIAGGGGPAGRLTLARKLLEKLPATNWLRRNPYVTDYLNQGDAGLQDLLFNRVDRAYLAPELVRLLNEAGLRFVTFIEPMRYEPAVYLNDFDLLGVLAALPPIERAAFAELLTGNMKQHIVYAVRSENQRATLAIPDSPDAIPILRDHDGATLAQTMPEGAPMTLYLDGIRLSLPLPVSARTMIAQIDGKRSLADIHTAVAADSDAPLAWEKFKLEFDQLYVPMNGANQLLLRYPPGVTAPDRS